MYNFANAVGDCPVLSERPKPKGYSNSVTLEKTYRHSKMQIPMLLALSDAISQHMRKTEIKHIVYLLA